MRSTPPRLAEALVASCITDTRLSDSVLGDLAEEWKERTQQKGAAQARVWYWQQCMKSAPYLVTEWWRIASLGEITRKGTPVLAVFGLVGLACVGTHYFHIALTDIMIGLLSASSEGGDPLVKNWDAIAYLSIAKSSSWGLIGGFGFALFLRNAPMASIAMLAVLWLPSSLVMPLILPPQWPTWAFIAFPVLMLSLSLVGGLVGTALRFYFREVTRLLLGKVAP